jgi:hypothetical protein
MPLVLPATFAGKTVACSRCGHAVLVSDPGAQAQPVLPPHLLAGRGSPLMPPPPPESPAPDPRPPHLDKPARVDAAIEIATAAVPQIEDRPAEAPRKRSCLASACLMVVVAALSLTAVAGLALGVVYLAWLLPRSPAIAEARDPSASGNEFNKRDYIDASRRARTIDGVTVRIDAAQVGKADFRSKGEILQTAKPHYLIVSVNVKNKNRTEPVTYRSWYSHKFEDNQGNRQDVELRDDTGRSWELFLIPDADTVERHVKDEVSLPTEDEFTDSLVFKLPEECIDEPIPPLYLQLPGAAVGNDSVYRLHLPSTMVTRRDR